MCDAACVRNERNDLHNFFGMDTRTTMLLLACSLIYLCTLFVMLSPFWTRGAYKESKSYLLLLCSSLTFNPAFVFVSSLITSDRPVLGSPVKRSSSSPSSLSWIYLVLLLLWFHSKPVACLHLWWWLGCHDSLLSSLDAVMIWLYHYLWRIPN